jgi:hypothetical protein
MGPVGRALVGSGCAGFIPALYVNGFCTAVMAHMLVRFYLRYIERVER